MACIPLPKARLDAIASAVEEQLGYDGQTRAALLGGISRRFVNLIPVGPIPTFQLSADLERLNSVPRLVDGTVPLEIWMKNAARALQPYPAESALLQQVLDELLTCSSGGPPVANPAEGMPTVPERIVDRDDSVAIRFLEGGYRAGGSVVRLVVPSYLNQTERKLPSQLPMRFNGTGWLATKELLFTNHHVVNARTDGEAAAAEADLKLQGSSTEAQFDFDDDAMVPTSVEVSTLEAWDAALDFAVLRLSAASTRDPLRLRAEKIDAPGADPVPVNVIQHPLGLAKKVALRNNHIFDCPYPRIRYFTDTQRGSSGSPVFDDGWRVIALHRATSFVQNVVFQGSVTGWVNEGVQMVAILDHLKEKHPALHAEILAAQP